LDENLPQPLLEEEGSLKAYLLEEEGSKKINGIFKTR
jgi:hypothetical protein